MMSLLQFVLLISHALVFAGATIRNDFTDRCLHIGYLAGPMAMAGGSTAESQREVAVYAASCSWNSGNGSEKKSHPDQWLEIVPMLNPTGQNPGRQHYFIRKVDDNTTKETCLLSSPDNHTNYHQPAIVPPSNHCTTSPQATFTLDMVDKNKFGGLITSKSSFKILNFAGNCLTIRPGQPFPKFTPCSTRHGLFQVWSVCRHNQKCDVDLTWTPRQIIFPKNDTNINYTYNEEPEVPEAATKIGKTGVVNEVLYTIQNTARLFQGSEQFLVTGIESFYATDILNQARSVLVQICKEENLQCDLCTQCTDDVYGVPSNLTITWLMTWVENCNKNDKIHFLSADILQLPLHLFPQQSSLGQLQRLPMPEKYKLIIPKLRKYMDELEASLWESEKDNQGNQMETVIKTTTSTTTTMSSVPADVTEAIMNTTHQDYASIIDIRKFNG